MTTNLAKWAPNNGQIIKSGLSDGRRAKFLPSVAGYDYYWLRTGGYLGNVGLNKNKRRIQREWNRGGYFPTGSFDIIFRNPGAGPERVRDDGFW